MLTFFGLREIVVPIVRGRTWKSFGLLTARVRGRVPDSFPGGTGDGGNGLELT